MPMMLRWWKLSLQFTIFARSNATRNVQYICCLTSVTLTECGQLLYAATVYATLKSNIVIYFLFLEIVFLI